MKLLERLLTKNLNEIPLLLVDLNYNKYKSDGAEGSCNAQIHPNLANDKYIHDTLNELITYIRNNYDMSKM